MPYYDGPVYMAQLTGFIRIVLFPFVWVMMGAHVWRLWTIRRRRWAAATFVAMMFWLVRAFVNALVAAHVMQVDHAWMGYFELYGLVCLVCFFMCGVIAFQLEEF